MMMMIIIKPLPIPLHFGIQMCSVVGAHLPLADVA
jgi:hypothetical protein